MTEAGLIANHPVTGPSVVSDGILADLLKLVSTDYGRDNCGRNNCGGQYEGCLISHSVQYGRFGPIRNALVKLTHYLSWRLIAINIYIFQTISRSD